jgi:phage baseplate assembly protein W
MSTYKDLNALYNSNVYNSKSVVSDLEDIKNGLMRLFTTGKGEVPYNRNYGTTLKSLLFENNVDASDVRMFLYMDITSFEPRVTLNPADIIITKQDNNTYLVKCTFRVPGLNSVSDSIQSIITR